VELRLEPLQAHQRVEGVDVLQKSTSLVRVDKHAWRANQVLLNEPQQRIAANLA